MSSELHQRDAEAVALAQQRDGAIEQSDVRAKDVAEYVSSLQQRIEQRDQEAELTNEKVSVKYPSTVVVAVMLQYF